LSKRNCQKHSSHYVLQLEVSLGTVWVRIMTTDTGLRHCSVWVECLKRTNPAFGDHACMGTTGIDQDLSKPRPLELSGWAILFVDCPS